MKGIHKKHAKVAIFTTLLLFVAGFVAWLVITKTLKGEQPMLSEAPVAEFSDGAYTIWFAKNGRGPKNDGSLFEIYSIKSDRTNLAFVKTENSALWEKEAFHNAAFENMGRIIGDTESPNRDKKLIVESGWFFFFSEPDVHLEVNGQRYFLMKAGISEFEWLPDGQRVVFSTAKKIGIIDTEAKKFGYLADGAGWIVVR